MEHPKWSRLSSEKTYLVNAPLRRAGEPAKVVGVVGAVNVALQAESALPLSGNHHMMG